MRQYFAKVSGLETKTAKKTATQQVTGKHAACTATEVTLQIICGVTAF